MASRTTKYEKLLEAVPDALVGMDQKGVIRFVNRQTETLFDYDRDQLIGRPVETLVPEPLWQIYAQNRDDYFADPRTRSSGLEVELSGRHRDGTQFPVNVSMAHIDTGDVLLVITAVADVTKHQVAVRNAQLLAAIVDASDDAIIGTTLEGVITSWNPAAERMYGYNAKEIIGRSGKILATPDQVEEMRAVLDRTRAGEVVEHLEINHLRKDGSVVPISLTVAPINDENGTVVGSSAVARDVTDQRLAFEAAERLAAIVGGSEDAIFGSTLDGTLTSWNEAAERLFGYSAQEMVGKSGRRLTPRGRTGETRALLAKVGASQHVEHLETVRVRKDGTAFPASLTVSPIRDPGGAVIGASAILRDVTEQRKASETAQRLAAIVESADDAILSGSLDGTITSWNPAAERLYGYSSQEIVGRSVDLLIPEDRRDETNQILAEIGAGQHVAELETVRVRKDGTAIPVSITVSAICNPAGTVVATSAVHHDMTAHMLKLEAAQRLAAIVESSTDAIVGRALDGTITSWNPAAEALYGYSSQEVIGKSASMLVPDGRTDETDAILARIEAGQPVGHREIMRVRKDGSVFPVSLTVSPIRDAPGTIVGASVVHRDITAHMLAFEAGQRMAAIVNSSEDAIIGETLDGVITSWNPAAEAMFGYSSKEIVGRSVSLLIPEDQADQSRGIAAKVAAGQHVEHLSTFNVRKDGTVFPISLTAAPMHDPDGAVTGTSVTCRDVSEQNEAFEAAQRMAAVVEGSNDAIMSGSLDGTITSWNPAAERMYGYSSAEIVGKPATTLTPADRRGEIRAVLAKIKAGQTVENFESTRLRKDGSAFPVALTVSPVRNADGAVVGTSVIHRDLTEQKGALADAQQIASIVEYSDDAIIGKTLDGTVTSWNPAAERMFGYSCKEMVGRPIGPLIPEDRTGEVISILAKTSAGKPVTNFETTRLRKDGTPVTVSLTTSPHRTENGAVVGASDIYRDVTALKHAAQYARSLIEAALDPLVTISPAGKITDVNEATVKVTGVPRHKLIGTDFSSYFTDPDKAHEGYERAFTQGSVTDYPLTLRHRDGALTDVMYNASVYRDSGGEVLGVFAAARDVTGRK